MEDVVAFLMACLAEDEKYAQGGLSFRQVGKTGVLVASDGNRAEECGALYWDGLAEHIVRHSPAQVLRDLAAKRAILAEHPIVHRDIGWLDGDEEQSDELPVCGRCVPKHSHYPRRADVPDGACRTVRLLAAPYADRDGYNPAWRVE